MIKREIELFSYSELTGKAKDKAREWWLECIDSDHYAESVTEGFKEALIEVGIGVTDTFFSGFWSQGDGACFDFKGVNWKKLREAPIGESPYAADLGFFRRDAKNALRLVNYTPDLWHAESRVVNHHYYHEKSRVVNLDLCDTGSRGNADRLNKVFKDLESDLNTLIQRLSRGLYDQLKAGYDECTSEESISDVMDLNKYTFLADGTRFG